MSLEKIVKSVLGVRGKVDNLGRVSLPMEIRRELGVMDGTKVDIIYQ